MAPRLRAWIWPHHAVPPMRMLCPWQASRGVKYDVELDGPDLREVCRRYKAVLAAAGVEVPHDPHEQLRAAICAVFGSWNTPRAVKYREINRIHGLKGTAVNIQVRTS